jgi:hypothetical protein
MLEEPLTLVSLKGGALVELFDRALEQVLKNIADPNTDAESVRKIKMEVAFKADEERTRCAVILKCTPVLAGIKPVGTIAYLGRIKGEWSAVENDPAQGNLFDKKAGPTSINAPGILQPQAERKEGA